MIEDILKKVNLYDEKRKLISVGDTIKFINTEDSNDTLSVTVTNLFVFTSFGELYMHLPLLKCGYNDENINVASPDDMNIYYSKEKQNKRRYRNRGITTLNYDIQMSLKAS